MPTDKAPNVTILCRSCGKEIWQGADETITLEEMADAQCADCYLEEAKKGGDFENYQFNKFTAPEDVFGPLDREKHEDDGREYADPRDYRDGLE